MITKEYLQDLAGYLFPFYDDEKIRDLYISAYYGNPEITEGNTGEFLKALCEKIPAHSKQDLVFAYTLANKAKAAFFEAVQADYLNKKSAKVIDVRASSALEEAMEQHGLEDNPDGMKHQDELTEKTIEEDTIVLGALLAGKGGAADAAEQIKKIDTNLKALQTVLKNISAIAEALLKGLNKIKSQWSETGIDYGRDLSKIDPSEFAYLQSEQTKQIFMLKLAKGELQQESEHDKKGLGDLIIAFDTSGSAFDFTRQGYKIVDLEIGIALAMARLANQNKCRSLIIPYHSRPYNICKDWMRGKNEINSYFAEMINGNKLEEGGTNFDAALNQVLRVFKADGGYPKKRKPGIIFITDGYDNVNSTVKNSVLKLKSGLGVKLYSYFVSPTDPRTYSKDLISISDDNYWINSNKSIESQIDSFQKLA